MLIDGLQTAYPNGFAYNQVRPAPDEEIPQRFAARHGGLRREALARRSSASGTRPASRTRSRKHREIQAVDPDALSDDELAAYLARCRDHHAAMITQHMRYTAGAMIPTGDFLAHVGDWTGIALRRAARPAAGRGAGVGRRVRRARAAEDDRAGPRRDEAPRVRRRPRGGARRAARRSAATRARPCRAISTSSAIRPLDGFDISEPSALELPDALLRSIADRGRRAAISRAPTSTT